jgi:hypothetical protein
MIGPVCSSALTRSTSTNLRGRHQIPDSTHLPTVWMSRMPQARLATTQAPAGEVLASEPPPVARVRKAPQVPGVTAATGGRIGPPCAEELFVVARPGTRATLLLAIRLRR